VVQFHQTRLPSNEAITAVQGEVLPRGDRVICHGGYW